MTRNMVEIETNKDFGTQVFLGRGSVISAYFAIMSDITAANAGNEFTARKINERISDPEIDINHAIQKLQYLCS